MSEQTKDVAVESSTTQEVVNTPATDTQVTAPVQETTQPSTVGQPSVDVDEFGVPWKNRAMEERRKREELTEKLPTLIEEKLSQFQPKQEREYTIAELEAFAAQSPQHRPWVEEEKAKIIQKNTVNLIKSQFDQQNKEKDAETKKANSYAYTVQNYSAVFPDAFVKDANGRVVGFNPQSRFIQEIDVLMRNKELASHPEGLAFAADAAYGRLARSQTPAIQQKAQELKEELRHAQKGQMVEGGSRPGVNSMPAHRQAIEQLKKTGNMKDAKAALDAIFEARRASRE